jgi:P-type E1-E2 ATPase
MIGDGLNDVLSLKEAGIGVSINAKSELNLMAADVIILSENLWKIVIFINLMKTANRLIYVNLIWALAYNLIMARIPLLLICSYCFWPLLWSGTDNFPHALLGIHVRIIYNSRSDLKHHEIFEIRATK